MIGLKAISSSTSIDCRFSGRPIIKCSLQMDVPNLSHHQERDAVFRGLELGEKIRKKIISCGKVEMSPSAYDTAWVAMVPSREISERPGFPVCLDWIMENQNPDGSWGLDPGHPFRVKDSLSCTLACLLALRKWNVGNRLLHRGIDFVFSNCNAAIDDDNQLSPIGFDIVFPAMLTYAKELDLALPPSLNALIHVRDSKIRELQNWEYVAEGFGKSCDWKQIMKKHQKRNGSLFNSPATTAAAAIHCSDDKCFDYLISVVNKCNGWAPTVYPMDVYTRIRMIDTLQRLGIDRHFRGELDTIFDEIYRKWQDREEEIFCDVTCQSVAFRLLRIKGYDVSSDGLEEFVEQEGLFKSTVSMQHKSVETVLELYRASQMRINEEESILDKIQAWTKPFLRQQLLNNSIHDQRLRKEVEYDLKNFYGTADRFQNRRTIDLYDARSSKMLKTAYRCSAIQNEDFIRYSVEDFKISRALYLKELDLINKWYSDCRLDELSEGRNACHQSYIITAALISDPELSMARISFAQAAILITVFDDFFDRYGTKQEAFTIIHLIKEWKPAPKNCSKQVEIIYTALYDTINYIADKAYIEQGFCFRHQLIGLWVLEYSVKIKEGKRRKSRQKIWRYI